MNTNAQQLGSSNHRNLFSKLVVGSASTICLIASTVASGEPGKVVGVEANNWIWNYSGTTITFDPDSGGPNQTCDLFGSEYQNVGNSIGGTMALVAMAYDSQFDSVDINCGAFEISLWGSGNQAFLHVNGEDAYEFTTINGVSCVTGTAGQGDKIAMAMATGLPMTATCTRNPWVNENILSISF